MKYIQSFYQYPVTFSSIGKTVPSSLAQGELKNLCEVSESELEKLQNCEPRFRELVNQKKYRVLNHIPASYVPPSQLINEANNEAERLRKENEELKAKLAAAGNSTEEVEAKEETETAEVAEEAKETKKTSAKKKH